MCPVLGKLFCSRTSLLCAWRMPGQCWPSGGDHLSGDLPWALPVTRRLQLVYLPHTNIGLYPLPQLWLNQHWVQWVCQRWKQVRGGNNNRRAANFDNTCWTLWYLLLPRSIWLTWVLHLRLIKRGNYQAQTFSNENLWYLVVCSGFTDEQLIAQVECPWHLEFPMTKLKIAFK